MAWSGTWQRQRKVAFWCPWCNVILIMVLYWVLCNLWFLAFPEGKESLLQQQSSFTLKEQAALNRAVSSGLHAHATTIIQNPILPFSYQRNPVVMSTTSVAAGDNHKPQTAEIAIVILWLTESKTNHRVAFWILCLLYKAPLVKSRVATAASSLCIMSHEQQA